MRSCLTGPHPRGVRNSPIPPHPPNHPTTSQATPAAAHRLNRPRARPPARPPAHPLARRPLLDPPVCDVVHPQRAVDDLEAQHVAVAHIVHVGRILQQVLLTQAGRQAGRQTGRQLAGSSSLTAAEPPAAGTRHPPCLLPGSLPGSHLCDAALPGGQVLLNPLCKVGLLARQLHPQQQQQQEEQQCADWQPAAGGSVALLLDHTGGSPNMLARQGSIRWQPRSAGSPSQAPPHSPFAAPPRPEAHTGG